MSTNELLTNERRLVEYVLGLLPEAETDRFDEASIVDDEVASHLSAVEDDLVDAYAVGALDLETRARFETNYLKSPRRREKVKFATRFLAAVDRAAVRPTLVKAAPASESERVRRFARRPEPTPPAVVTAKFSWPLASAAASFILACVVLANDFQLRQVLNAARDKGAAQDRQAQQLTQQLADARHENSPIAQALAEGQRGSPAASLSAPSIPSIGRAARFSNAPVLSPQTRSLGQPPIVDVATGATDPAFDLRLEANDFRRYRATLQESESGRIVWHSVLLTPRRGTASIVSLVVPSVVLESRHYSFELAGVDAAGHETPVGSYAVQINRQQGSMQR